MPDRHVVIHHSPVARFSGERLCDISHCFNCYSASHGRLSTAELLVTGCLVAPALCLWRLALLMGDGNFWSAQNQHPLTDHQRIWYRWLRRRSPWLCKFGANPSMGGFWANGWNITKIFFIYLFIKLGKSGYAPRFRIKPVVIRDCHGGHI